MTADNPHYRCTVCGEPIHVSTIARGLAMTRTTIADSGALKILQTIQRTGVTLRPAKSHSTPTASLTDWKKYGAKSCILLDEVDLPKAHLILKPDKP